MTVAVFILRQRSRLSPFWFRIKIRNMIVIVRCILGIAVLTSILLAAGPAGWAADQWTRIGPGGGGAQFDPTVSPHDPAMVLVRCDMTGGYITRNSGRSWSMFNLGGVQFFAFDPRDPRTVYALGMGMWRSTDSGQTWNLVYPTKSEIASIEMPSDHADGRIVTKDGRYPHVAAMAIDPKNSKQLYAAVSEGNAASLLESADAGKLWRKTADLPTGVIRLFVQDNALTAITPKSTFIREAGAFKEYPTPAQLIDVSTGDNRIYAISRESLHISDNGGRTWRHSAIRSFFWKPRLSAIATSANHSDVAYVSYSNLHGRYFGVAKTTDAGRSWSPVWKESSNAPAENVHDVWVTQRFGPDWGENPLSLGVAPTDPNIVYGTDSGRTMRSTDGGKTWSGVYSKKTSAGFTTTGLDVTTSYGVHFDPFNPKRRFITYTDIGLFRSEDAGKSWFSSTTGVPASWVNTTYWIEFDPAVEGRMWAAMSRTHDLPRPKMWRTGTSHFSGGVAISDDGGRKWRKASESLPPSAATHILLDPQSPKSARALYMTAFGRGVFKSSDGGATWKLKNSGIEGAEPFAWRIMRDGRGSLYLIVARRSEDASYGTPHDGALYRSTDHAEHWRRIPLPEGLNGPNGLAIDPKDPDRMYLAAWGRAAGKVARDGGIWISTDAGSHWRNVHSKDQHVYDVTIDPRNPSVLYASGFESSAWRSTDRGETWRRIAGYDFKWGHRVIPDPASPDSIYVTTFGGSVWHGPANRTAPLKPMGPVRWNPPPEID
jgi:photosystem II stability/assembly factor-like uncharacterized protein